MKKRMPVQWEAVKPKIIAAQLAINFRSDFYPVLMINQTMREVADVNLKRIQAYQDRQYLKAVLEQGADFISNKRPTPTPLA